MIKLIYAEYCKLQKSIIFYFLCGLLLLFITYMYSDFVVQKIEIKGYLISVSLASLTVVGQIIIILVSALLAYNDIYYKTLPHLLMSNTRKKVFASKIIMIGIMTSIIIITVVIYSILLNYIYNVKLLLIFPEQFWAQIIAVYIFLLFWGIVTFIVVLITDNIVTGIVVSVFWSSSEYLVYIYAGDIVNKYLPLYNLKSILLQAFSNLKAGSMIIIPEFYYSIVIYSYIYIVLLVVLMLILGWRYFKTKEIQS